MLKRRWSIPMLGLLLAAANLPDAQAAMPVVDVRAIAQMVQEIRTLQDQLATARDHLTQARQTYQSMTGSRGMERLLSATERNYLPADWAELAQALQGVSGSHSALASLQRTAMADNAVLTTAQLGYLPPDIRAQVDAERHATALRQAITRDALANTSNRFRAIQQLTDAIPRAADPKAVLDLQARIQVELGMLQNEQTKLQILEQGARADEAARRQRDWETAVAGQGRFATRFRPHP